jgi:hypothetical protein
MALTRTPEEITARMEAVKGRFMDFQFGDLLEWLPFDLAKPSLKDHVTEQEWNGARKTGDPLDEVREYLPFAWEKANDCRGLSAMRSVSHMTAWLWLAGYDLEDEFEARYTRYGKPCLIIASEIAGFDWGAADDGEWVNEECGPALTETERNALAADAASFALSMAAANA